MKATLYILLSILVTSCLSTKLCDRKKSEFFDTIIEASKNMERSIYTVALVSDDSNRKYKLVVPINLLLYHIRIIDTTINRSNFSAMMRDNLYKKKYIKINSNELPEGLHDYLFMDSVCKDYNQPLKKLLINCVYNDGFLKPDSLINQHCVIASLFERRIFITQDSYSGYYVIEGSKRIKKLMRRLVLLPHPME